LIAIRLSALSNNRRRYVKDLGSLECATQDGLSTAARQISRYYLSEINHCVNLYYVEFWQRYVKAGRPLLRKCVYSITVTGNDKKLSYRREAARRAMLVNLCCFIWKL